MAMNSLFESTKLSGSEIKINSLNELSVGDHAIIVFDLNNYCHLIVENVLNDHVIQAIYYRNEQFSKPLGDYFKVRHDIDENKNEVPDDRTHAVMVADVVVDFKIIDVYKVVYKCDTVKCLDPVKTVKKAKSLIGQEKYDVFTNNDENFAIYCKIGKAGQLLIANPDLIELKDIFSDNLLGRIRRTLTKTGAKMVIINTANHIATHFHRNVIAANLPVVVGFATSAFGISMAGISMGCDIHKKYQKNVEGEVSKDEFTKYVAKRVSKGGFGIAGGFAGAFIGQTLIPIPVVGGLVGGFVGGMLGTAVGLGQGVLFGSIYDKISSTVRNKEAISDDTSKKETLKEDEFQPEYEDYVVIDNVFFIYDDEITGENQESKLIGSKVEEKGTENTSHTQFTSDPSNQKIINTKDYDVFVLEQRNVETNENNKYQ